MKKVLFLFAMLLMVITTYSQSATVVVDGDTLTESKCSIPYESKVTMSKVYSDVKAGLVGLADGLKTTAEHVYVVLVRQQIVYAVSYTILDLFLIILTIFFSLNFIKNNRRFSDSKDDWYHDDFEDHFGSIGMLIISIILGILTIISLSLTISDIMTGFINPEYGAIKDIINFIK